MQSVSSVQPLSCVQLFATPWTAAYQASLSITNSQSMLKFMSSSRWYHPTISSSVIPFSSYLQSLPASLFQQASSSHQMANIIIFTLAQPLHSFWNYFSTLLQKYIGHLLTWRVHLSVSYLFAFSYCSWGSQGKNTEVVCHSLLQWTMFCQDSPPWPVHLGWPYTAWHSMHTHTQK